MLRVRGSGQHVIAANKSRYKRPRKKGANLVVSPDNSATGSIRATLRNITGQFTGNQWRRISFYLGVPLLLGVYGAMNNFHSLASMGHVGYLMFYLGHAMVPFWISCVSTQLVTIILAPLHWPLLPRLALGGFIAGFAVLPYASWLAGAGSGPEAGADSAVSFHLFSREFLIYSIRATLVWIGINLLFDRFLGLPRYRYPVFDIMGNSSIDTTVAGRNDAAGFSPVIRSGDANTDLTPVPPAVLQLAPVPLRSDQLLAMCAEEHYVRLITTQGEFLVYHRFSDALNEVKSLRGLRVHRSHWVAEGAVAHISRSAKKMFIEIDANHQVPVSRPYQAMVLQLAEQANITVGGLEQAETFLP